MNFKSGKSTLWALSILTATLLLSIDCQAAKQQQQVNGGPAASQNAEQLAVASHSKSWLPHAKARSSRSLSDMFEKVKSKIFGGKKSSSSASSSSASNTRSQIAPSGSSQSSLLGQLQPSTTSNNLAMQRQPWDLNSFNQQQYGQLGSQVSPAAGQYQQWPTSAAAISASNPFGLSPPNQAAFASQLSYSAPGQPSYSAGLVPGGVSMDALQASASSQQPQQANVASVPSSGPTGILSSASHLISQYLSPGGASPQQQQQQQSAIQQQQQQQQQAQSLLTPNQQSQYNEFASMLDSMVAQTGLSPPMQQQQQRQPNSYINNGQPNTASANQNMYSQAGQLNGNMMSGDNEMMGSSNIQMLAQPGSPAGSSPVSVGAASAIAPSASSAGGVMQAQASGKSNMVSLAEQLAPGAQFNKLISFPFSLSNNDDPNKEGRFKLHIPFLNQHVKRSDHHQQQQQLLNQQQQQQQQSYYNQQPQQQYVNNNVQSQSMSSQMLGQASQPVSSIVSPAQSSVSNSLPSHSQVSPTSSIVQAPSQSQSVSVSSSSSSSSSAISQQSPSVPSSQQ